MPVGLTLDLKAWKPYPGKILGKIEGGDYESPGGIIIVDSLKKKKPRRVRVFSLGRPFLDDKGNPGKYRAKTGQIAYFKLAEGVKITINREDYLILDNKDIIAKESLDKNVNTKEPK